ncbi:alpha-hydroxy acid oxidase [Zoogloea sp.]|uniref:alpha-hydroxy acid oxidase n=1 Tax=Zoogloea sp. TaxID=49181 RepID=UPI0025FDBBEF|nr:alpha-hydroxy acid oxidase [Zoogloea sp.]MCK6395155.1 alpha-hydroxy-acid oxidizing protein [Zoogloea sp.]
MSTRNTLPEGVISLPAHEAHARHVLDANAWAYFAGGAADEHTLRANPAAWEALALHPRILRPVAGGHTRVSLLGRSLAHPILLAPVAYQRMAHPDGELGSAVAASAQEAGLVLSTQASTPLEAVADAIRSDPDRGPLWFQLYLQHDRGFNIELIRRAEAAGYEALVLTVDAPCSGARDRERAAGFRLPPGISAVNLAGLPPRPARDLAPGRSGLFDDLLHDAPTWNDIAWLQAQTRLPVILKGVLHPEDAREAVRQQVGGLIVSNHGGRTLDTLPTTANALPAVVDAVDGSLPVLVDGGIRRGTDVLKAMALGASAVLIGRPYIFGLANAGALGVAHVIRLLRDELEIAMALCGARTLQQLPNGLLGKPAQPAR